MAKKTKAVTAAKQDRERDALEHRNKTDRAASARVERGSALLDPDSMQTAVERMGEMLDAYTSECAKLKPNGEMPQRLIALAHLSTAALDTLSGIRKAFNETALTMRKKGRFEAGQCVVSFEKQGGRRTPAWKEEAVSRARESALLKGKSFNEKRYVERVIERTEPSPDTYKPFIEVRD